MKHIKEIIYLIKHCKLKASDFIISHQDKSSKVNTFYQKVANETLLTDEEAANFFYQSGANNSNYKSLKSKLKNKLINTLFFFNTQSKLSEREKAYLYCGKYAVAAKVAIIFNARYLGIDLCKKVLKKALYYEFTDYILDVTHYLRSHSAIRLGDPKKFNHYNDLLVKYIKVREMETIAGELYLKIQLPYKKTGILQETTYQQAVEAFKQLKPMLNHYQSPYLIYMIYYIEALIPFSKSDYNQTITICQKAINIFKTKPYTYSTAIKAFLHLQIICCTQLKQYDDGKLIAEKSLSFLKTGSYNWYTNLNLYLTLAFHSQKYQEAYFIFNKAVSNRKFNQLNPITKEKWHIFEAYIHFLIFTKKINPNLNDKRFTNFRMGKFLNSVPTFSKDKKGLNIPILIIQILFMIIKKDYDQAINRIEAIEKYCLRYLRKNDNFRSNCFIKMLLQIPISNFHQTGIKRRTKKYFALLQSEPLRITKQTIEVEIIPYENIWNIILESLDTKFHHAKDKSPKDLTTTY